MQALFDGHVNDITMSAKGEEGISNHSLRWLYTLYTITHPRYL